MMERLEGKLYGIAAELSRAGGKDKQGITGSGVRVNEASGSERAEPEPEPVNKVEEPTNSTPVVGSS